MIQNPLFPRVVTGAALVAQAAPGVDPARPVDANGREIRVGFTITWRDLMLTVSSWGRSVVDGEAHWHYMLIIDREQAADYGVYAIPLGDPDNPVVVIDPPATAPAAATTDDILHRLRELVAEDTTAVAPAEDRVPNPAARLEWVELFDELDYRMSRAGYPTPSQWRR
jgi:hypothetical protein